jgi:hypothetical protein
MGPCTVAKRARLAALLHVAGGIHCELPPGLHRPESYQGLRVHARRSDFNEQTVLDMDFAPTLLESRWAISVAAHFAPLPRACNRAIFASVLKPLEILPLLELRLSSR